MISVLINGAGGRMGQEAVKAVNADCGLNLVAMGSRQDNLAKLIEQHQPQVVVDLTTAECVLENTKTIIEHNVHPVIGASGLTAEQLQSLQATCEQKQLGGLIVPNFSIGAVLMMQLASKAAPYFSRVEIIEQHHDKKLDAPSGTAVKTAELIKAHRAAKPDPLNEKELHAGARGADFDGIPIHSVRLPGLVAKQQVIYGGVGETLTIEHNSIHRESFMPGLVLACKKVSDLKALHYGLDVVLG